MSDYLTGLIVGMALGDSSHEETETKTEYVYYDNTPILNYGISKELVKFEVYKNKQVKAIVDKLKKNLEEKIDKTVENSELAMQKHAQEFEKLNLQKEEIYKKVEAMGFTPTTDSSCISSGGKFLNPNILDNCVETKDGCKFNTFAIQTLINDCKMASQDIEKGNFFQHTYNFLVNKINYKYEEKGGLDVFLRESNKKIAEMESKSFRLKNFPSFKKKYTVLLSDYYCAVHDAETLNNLKVLLKRAESLTQEEKQTLLDFQDINQKLIDYSAQTEEIKVLNDLKKQISKQFASNWLQNNGKNYVNVLNELFAQSLKELNSNDSKVLGSFVDELASFAVENPNMLKQVAFTPSRDYGWEESIIYQEGLVGAINQMVELKTKELEKSEEKTATQKSNDVENSVEEYLCD